MKAKLPMILFTICILFSSHSYAQTQPNSSDKQALIMLKDFYTGYMTEFIYVKDLRYLQKNLDSVTKKYCTINLLKKIHKLAADRDADAILNAQDCSPGCLKTLQITKDPGTLNFYTVSYAEDYVIHLAVVKQGDSFKVDSLWYPKFVPDKSSTDPESRTVKLFYQAYIMGVSNKIAPKMLNSIKSQYCTENLLNKIEKETHPGDLDPFLKSRHIDPKWPKSLLVIKDAKNANLIIVSYVDADKKTQTVHVSVVKPKSGFRIIDAVW